VKNLIDFGQSNGVNMLIVEQFVDESREKPPHDHTIETVLLKNNIKHSFVDVETALNSNEKFVFILMFRTLIRRYLLELHLEPFLEIDKRIIDCINSDKCIFYIDALNEVEDYQNIEKQLLLHLAEANIDYKKVNILHRNPITGKTIFNLIYWQWCETGQQFKAPNIDFNKKFQNDYKMFLCLNRYDPNGHKTIFVDEIIKRNLLSNFNISLKSRNLNYDVNLETETSDLHEVEDFFSYDNLIFIVTESNFQDLSFRNISEKTWKPIMLKMPFIIVGDKGTLKTLKHLGYKTFSHMWNEDYDDCDSKERMAKVCQIVSDLSSMGKEKVKKLIIDNKDILDYNYKHFINRKAEEEFLDHVQNNLER